MHSNREAAAKKKKAGDRREGLSMRGLIFLEKREKNVVAEIFIQPE